MTGEQLPHGLHLIHVRPETEEETALRDSLIPVSEVVLVINKSGSLTPQKEYILKKIMESDALLSKSSFDASMSLIDGLEIDLGLDFIEDLTTKDRSERILSEISSFSHERHKEDEFLDSLEESLGIEDIDEETPVEKRRKDTLDKVGELVAKAKLDEIPKPEEVIRSILKELLQLNFQQLSGQEQRRIVLGLVDLGYYLDPDNI